jgi:transposase-like protein
MATRSQFKLSISQRRLRSFSVEFKKEKVLELERRIITISELSRQYDVSPTSIHRWIKKFSTQYSKGIKTIVETESDTRKLLELQARIAELERVIGQKQVQLDFKDKMIDLAENFYGIDIKKKFENRPSSGSGSTGSSSSVA